MWNAGCQDGSEIPDGTEIVNSASPITITIDATRITPTELISSCGGVLRFDSTVIQSISAPAGTCVLETGGGGVIGAFTVTNAGTIDYASSLDIGVFSGRGTSTLTVVPHGIAIDATGLTQTTLRFAGATSMPTFDSGVPQHLALASTAGFYYAVETAGSGLIGFFKVTPAGTVDYDASLDGVFSGRGTCTLSVVPHAIAIDATGLTQTTLRFAGATSIPTFDSGVIQHPALASTAGFYYAVETAGSGLIGFFKVTPTGTVDYDLSLDGVFSGRGTSTLSLVPHPIAIDATGLTQTTLRFAGVTSMPTFDSGVPQHLALASTAGFYYAVQTVGSGLIGFFKVTPAGTVDYDASLDGVFSGRGTATLSVVPYPIAIDATGLTQTTLRFAGATSIPTFDSGVIQHPALASTAGFYYAVETAGSGLIGFFKVTPTGTVDYDLSLDGVFSGRGTATLSVVPHPIAIDATGLTQTTLRFAGATSMPTFDSGVIQHLALASTAGFYYAVQTAGSSLIGFFKVTPTGTVDYDASLDGVFSGRNTSTLTIVH